MSHKHDDPFATIRLNDVGDFTPEWDVPEQGRAFSDAFSKAIDSVRAHPELDPNRTIHAFLGPAGYGKTHLFGRINHAHAERVHFVFIQAISGLEAEDKVKQLESVLRWRLVEALLYSNISFAPLRLQLAKLLTPSFRAYFDRLDARMKEQCASIREGLAQDDPLTVLEMFGQVEGIGAYHHLADAVRVQMRHCSGHVIRALVLGVSPAADDARWWLRGEADQVPGERLAALKLPEESPPLFDILYAVAEILRRNRIPLVVCFDQLDELFKTDRSGFSALTIQLMSWLQSVPNLLLGIGSLENSWDDVVAQNGFRAFSDRTSTHLLPLLRGDEAVSMLVKRLETWSEADAKRERGWPFDLASVKQFAEKTKLSPRSFIQVECRPRFATWLAGKRQGLITFGAETEVTPIDELFKQEWAKELESVKTGKKPTDLQDVELWAGVEESLFIAKAGQYPLGGVQIQEIQKQPLDSTANDTRPSARVVFASGNSVVVAVSKKDSGNPFGHWYTALDKAKQKSVGAVVVWPQAKLAIGKTSAAYMKYSTAIENKAIRPFPLDEHEATFHQLECLRRVMLAAKTGNLMLGKQTVGVEDCRQLIVKTGLLANLKLFEFVFQNWPGLESASPIAAMSPPAHHLAPVPLPKPVAPAPTEPIASTQAPTVAPQPSAASALPEWVELMLKKVADHLKKKGQPVQPAGAVVGPTFVRLKVELRGDADFSKVKRQAENLKVQLSLEQEPLILSQAGYVSLDVQRPDRQTVLLGPLLAACPAKFAGEPAFPVGVGVAGNTEWLNLSEPEGCHLLVAGTTGSGKSEFLKAMIAALAARLEPSQVKFRLIDPKRVTFNVPANCPYLGGPVVYDGEEALPVLEACTEEMERRYKILQVRGVDHIRHLTGADVVPRWVVVMDEFADLMTDKSTKKQLEPLLKRLGAKARAAGIHLILGTQRPDATVVTPVLRSNLPGKIGLQVGSERESKLFLDEPDAAYLFGKGDLVWKRGGGLVRLQSPFVPKSEFEKLLRVG